MKLNRVKNQSLWRAFAGKPALAVVVLLLCVAFVSAAVQADDATTNEQQPDFPPYLTIDYTIACDTVAPIAAINALPTFSPRDYQATWGGANYAPSGCAPADIAHYDIQYRHDGGPWTDWRAQVTITSDTFTGGSNGDGQYGFEALATNSVPQTETRNYVSEAVMVVDLDDNFHPAVFMPILFQPGA